MKYFDIIKQSAENETSFDLGPSKEGETVGERLADACTDQFIDGLMSRFASI